jgi:hypothetical protein
MLNSMKIMIYIEPLIEIGTPRAKSYWVYDLAPRIVKSIKSAFKGDVHITLISGATFTAPAGHEVDRVILIDPLSLVDPWIDDPDTLLIKALKAPRGPEAAKLAKSLLQQLFYKDFDIIIAFGSPAYLRLAFPDAAILFHEFSFFKTPGPATWYFDPIGPGGSAWLDRYWATIRKTWRPPDAGDRLARRYREIYRSTVTTKCPCPEDLAGFKSRFSKTVLLPLQLDRLASYEAVAPIPTQFNLALGVSSNLSPDIGLVITEHPRPISSLTDEGREYLWSRQNVFFAQANGGLAPSDSVAPYVDGVATVSSTAGMLSLLWSKTLISLSGHYMTSFADSCGRPPWKIGARNEDEDLVALQFLMTHWCVHAQQLEDPQWMKAMLLRANEQARNLSDPALPPIPEWKAGEDEKEKAWLAGFELS